jgi:hypothetical protein
LRFFDGVSSVKSTATSLNCNRHLVLHKILVRFTVYSKFCDELPLIYYFHIYIHIQMEWYGNNTKNLPYTYHFMQIQPILTLNWKQFFCHMTYFSTAVAPRQLFNQ